MKTRTLSLLLVAALLITMLAGCAGGNSTATVAATTTVATTAATTASGTTAAATTTAGTTAATTTANTTAAVSEGPFHEAGYPIFDEEVTYKAMNAWDTSTVKWGDDQALFRAMHELTNITFEFQNIPNTDWDTKMNLSFASGDLPDLYLSSVGSSNLYTYGVKGNQLYNFADKLEGYMPNLVALGADYPNLLKVSVQNDGGIYSMPALCYTPTVGAACIYVRTDYMNECGITKEPETVSELYDLCVALKDHYADMEGFIPFMMQNANQLNGWAENMLFPAMGEYISSTYQADPDGKIVYAGITEQMLHYLQYVHKLYEEKLINPEIYTMDDSTAMSLIQNGQCGVTTYGTIIKPETFASGNYDVSLLGPLTSEYSQIKHITMPNIIYNSGYAITTKCENPDALLRWFDILYSRDDVSPGLNATSAWLGIRGETYEYTDDSHKLYKRLAPEGTENINAWVVSYASPQIILGMEEMAIANDASAGLKVKGLGFLEKHLQYTVDPFPLGYLHFSDEDTERYNSLTVDINNYVDQMKAKFVTGTESLDNWDSYAANLEKMGLSDVLEIIQKGYDEFMK
ncbi:MAG: extracellular solute-binding protein [Clostridiaceae bacterium]|nr:extracellular solute-binding protein [Clostridiaceae bacterium]